MKSAERHLDIGSGPYPANPYRRPNVFAIDVRNLPTLNGTSFVQADLTVNTIPFPDNYFASVSALDYLEHVPRVILSEDGVGTVFPFVRLMSEIWRVLEPDGLLYAISPIYPHPAAFADPTHVNFITKDTHQYFCGDTPKGRMYGFAGRYCHVRTELVVKKDALIAGKLALTQRIRRLRYKLQGRLYHYLWELQAKK